MIVHQLTRLCLPALAAMMPSIAACDAMTDDGYRGELLFALDGKIENSRQVIPSDVQLYLLWASSEGPNVAEQLEIAPTFPATFRLDVFKTPHVLPPWDGDKYGFPQPPEYARLTIGHIVAATSDTEFQEFLSFPSHHRDPGILGVDPRHMIYYMAEDLPEGSVGAAVLHGAVKAGFHVYDVKCIGPTKAAEIRACVAQYRAEGRPDEAGEIYATCGHYNPDEEWLQLAPDDLQTQLTVELIDDLPSWKPDPSECL
jgi:hypothetical protein